MAYIDAWSSSDTPTKKKPKATSRYMPSLTGGGGWYGPRTPTGVSVGPLPPTTTKTTSPYTPPAVVQPTVTQPVAKTSTGGAGGFDFSAMMKGYQPTPWTPPQLPQEALITPQMIADWQARAKNEAGMQFDPQLLAIQQEFEKMMLGAEQAKGGIDPAYQDIIDYVTKWQEEETGATQRRHYARGLGRGGGLIEEEGKIGERALKEITAAGTERARKLGDIEEQKMLMMEQSGAKKEDIEAQRGRYVAARSSDLEESYRMNKQQLEQQRFANQMQIAQVGMSKEADDFNRWLGTMSLANDVWYREQTVGLERESMALSERARVEALNWQKERAASTGAGGTAGMTEYQTANLAEQQRQFNEQLKLSKEESEWERNRPLTSLEELEEITSAQELDKYKYPLKYVSGGAGSTSLTRRY